MATPTGHSRPPSSHNPAEESKIDAALSDVFHALSGCRKKKRMTALTAFLKSLKEPDPPAGLVGPLLALWHAEKGEWDAAHRIVMNDDSREAAWVHACLHRQEGDLGNAGYWYRRAGQPVAEGPIEAERRAIAEALTGGR
jgi:hypothetical protein